jgi:plasmid maintenance system antidote protein VapI
MTDQTPREASIADALHLDSEQVDAGRAIAEISPDAAGLLVGVLQRSAEESHSIQERIDAWKDEEIARWRRRALRAEAELRAVRANLDRLGHPDPEMIDLCMADDEGDGASPWHFRGEFQ